MLRGIDSLLFTVMLSGIPRYAAIGPEPLIPRRSPSLSWHSTGPIFVRTEAFRAEQTRKSSTKRFEITGTSGQGPGRKRRCAACSRLIITWLDGQARTAKRCR